MAKKNVIKLGAMVPELRRILSDYGQELSDVMLGPAAEQAAEYAQKELTATSPVRTGYYKRNWTISHTRTTNRQRTIVHSENAYQLPHLLQNGHALRRGGRTIGQVAPKHDIASVNERTQEMFLQRFEELVRRGGKS